MNLLFEFIYCVDHHRNRLWQNGNINILVRLYFFITLTVVVLIPLSFLTSFYFSVFIFQSILNIIKNNSTVVFLDDILQRKITNRSLYLFYKKVMEDDCLICFQFKQCFTTLKCAKTHPCCEECLNRWNSERNYNSIFKCVVCKQ
jgi:hypothetical protein